MRGSAKRRKESKRCVNSFIGLSWSHFGGSESLSRMAKRAQMLMVRRAITAEAFEAIPQARAPAADIAELARVNDPGSNAPAR